MGFISADGSMNNEDLDRLRRDQHPRPAQPHPGVGDVTMFGSQYAMRIWLDPAKLNNYGLTTSDVVAAIRAQNVQVSVGSIGGLPAAPGQAITRQHHRADAPVHAGAVPQHPAAREPRRLAGAHRRRRARRAQLRKLHARHQVQRQARGRRRHPPRGGAERARHRQRHPRHHRPAGAVLPARASRSSIRSTRRRSCAPRSTKW